MPASDLAAAYGEFGKLLMAAEFLDAAEPCFENAQTLEPSVMDWPYYLGHIERLKNQPARAASRFEQALRLKANHVPSLVWLGEMDLAEGRPEAAEPLFTSALALEPQSVTALYGLGRISLAKGDYAEAVTVLERALALAPQASRIQYPLAMAYRGQGDLKQAEAHLRQRGDIDVPAHDPLMAGLGGLLQNAAAYELRGAEALGRRQWSEAITNLQRAITLAPDNASTRLNLGTALYLSGNTAGALEQLQAAVRLAPGLSKAYYGIGVIKQAQGLDQEAIAAFSAAVKADPSLVEARLQLADALRSSGRPADALSHYTEVRRADPGISQASFGYAMALVQLHKYQEARDRLEDAVRTYADQPGFAHALARLLAAAPDDRIRDGRRALMLVRPLLAAQHTLALAETMAMADAEVGAFEQAVTWQRDAIREARRTQPDALRRLEENLKRYEARVPCRTPWRDDDPVFHPRPAS
jgi:tetratricopeptide (TPR) repeat protein